MEPVRGAGHGEVDDASSELERRMEMERRRVEEMFAEGMRLQLVHQALLREEGRFRGVPASCLAIVALRVPTEAETAGQDCAVCLDGLDKGDRRLRMMPCSHAFHQPCIFNWLKVNGVCPCCRFRLPVRTKEEEEDEEEDEE